VPAAGRGISLPSSAIGMAKLAARTVGGYARVRQQFKTPIGKFEGIEEPLTRIGGNLYMMEAAGALTAAAVDLGEKPAVLSGIASCTSPSAPARSSNDAWTSSAARASAWASNFIGAAYMGAPVAITVEGANILTRSLIVYGQGAIRCHPYVLKEMSATRERDHGQALLKFDEALFATSGSCSRTSPTWVMGLTGSHFVGVRPAWRRRRGAITSSSPGFSAALAFLSDVSMGVLGGALKRKEKLSARLGDILSLMYLCSPRSSATRPKAGSRPTRRSCTGRCGTPCSRRRRAGGVISNFPNRVIAFALRRLVFRSAGPTSCRRTASGTRSPGCCWSPRPRAIASPRACTWAARMTKAWA